MSAITVNVDAELLEKPCHHASWRNACSDVLGLLEGNGFVECIAVAQDVADAFDGFTPALKDIRMLRIEEDSDLMVVLDRKRRRRKA